LSSSCALEHVNQGVVVLARLDLGHTLSPQGLQGLLGVLSEPLGSVLVELVPLGCQVRPLMWHGGHALQDVLELLGLDGASGVVDEPKFLCNLCFREPSTDSAVGVGDLQGVVLGHSHEAGIPVDLQAQGKLHLGLALEVLVVLQGLGVTCLLQVLQVIHDSHGTQLAHGGLPRLDLLPPLSITLVGLASGGPRSLLGSGLASNLALGRCLGFGGCFATGLDGSLSNTLGRHACPKGDVTSRGCLGSALLPTVTKSQVTQRMGPM
jgi:hypothetical protein